MKCPNCNKEVTEQMQLEIPTFIRTPTFSVKELDGVTHGSLVYENGEYQLVLESVAKCPYCNESFAVDIWLPVLQKF
jgi:DNA-directed RNA polymerase subunit RPC12/RpoP